MPVNRDGFTIPELLVTILLVTLMAAIAVPGLVRTLANARLRAAAQHFASDLRLAQGRAQRHARPVRVMIDQATGLYRLEEAKTTSAPADCITPYELIAQGDLAAAYQAVFSATTADCIVFEASGRPGGANPQVLTGLTTSGTPNDKQWTRYLNGATATADNWVMSDAQTIYWLGIDEVVVTLDLGAALAPEWICPSLVSSDPDFDDIPFPHSVQLEISDRTGSTPPGAGDWTLWERIEAPYADVYTSSLTEQWHTVCPASSLDRPVRYLRYTFQVAESDLWGYTMALDEIKLPPPSVTIASASGSGSRKVTIARITGKVSHE